MKIKIIKRAERLKISEKIPAAQRNQPENGKTQRAVATTVKFWIEDSRQKREQELISVKKLFSEGFCA